MKRCYEEQTPLGGSIDLLKQSWLTVFTVVSSEAGLTHTLTGAWVTAHGDLLALAFTEAPLAPVTRLTCCEDSQILQRKLSTRFWYVQCFRFLCNYVILSSATLALSFLKNLIKSEAHYDFRKCNSYMLHSRGLVCQEGRHSVQSVGHK